jgi:fructoselysine transporter
MAAYILISICTGAIVPFDILTSIEEGKFVNPFAYLDAFSNYAGGIFAVAVFVSMLGVMNSSVLTQPRLEYAMAKDGLFFKSFGRLHPKYLTPDFSIIIQSILAIFLLFLGNIGDLLGYFTLSYLLQNTLVFGSIFFLRKKEDYKPHFKAPAWFLMAVLSMVIQVFIIFGTFSAFPLWGVVSCIVLILTGLPLYLFFKKGK